MLDSGDLPILRVTSALVPWRPIRCKCVSTPRGLAGEKKFSWLKCLRALERPPTKTWDELLGWVHQGSGSSDCLHSVLGKFSRRPIGYIPFLVNSPDLYSFWPLASCFQQSDLWAPDVTSALSTFQMFARHRKWSTRSFPSLLHLNWRSEISYLSPSLQVLTSPHGSESSEKPSLCAQSKFLSLRYPSDDGDVSTGLDFCTVLNF